MRKIVLAIMALIGLSVGSVSSEAFTISVTQRNHLDTFNIGHMMSVPTGGVGGFYVSNPITRNANIMKFGTGFDYTTGAGIGLTGGRIGINNLPMSSTLGLQTGFDAMVSGLTSMQTSIGIVESLMASLNAMITGAQLAITNMQFDFTGMQASLALKEPAITAGSPLSYRRGDKTRQTLPIIPTSISSFANDIGYLTGLSLSPYITGLALTPYITGNYVTVSMSGKQDKFTGTINQFVLGNGSYGTWSQTGVTRTLNNGFMISATKGTNVAYSVGITSTATLIGGQLGAVVLEIASNSGFTGNLQEIGRIENGNSVSLAIALTAIQNMTSQLNGFVPPGYYVRLRTIQTTGTPTFAWKSGQEMLIG